MTKDQKQILKFAICTIACIGILYLTTVRVWCLRHTIGIVLCIAAILWYGYHFYTDKE